MPKPQPSHMIDSAVNAVRRDTYEPAVRNIVYATIDSSLRLVINGGVFTDYIKYDSVGTLENGDVVEVLHDNNKRAYTVVGKLLNVRQQIGRQTYAWKTGNETVTSSTVLQNDDHLSLAVLASATYFVSVKFIVGGNDTADMKYAFTYPASATLAGGQINLLSSTAAGASTAGDGDFRGLAAQTTPSTALNLGIPDVNLTIGIYEGTLIMSSTAGTLQVQWAQLASDGTGTTVYAGSKMTLTRVA